jgi:alginate O-acetyltransferase complex protein AlgI
MIYTDTFFIVLLTALWGLTQFLRALPATREWVIIGFSLLFVASWGPLSLFLLLGVALVNFFAVKMAASWLPMQRRGIVIFAIAFDLLILAGFKYGQFIGSNLPTLAQIDLNIPVFGFPLAVSFYTFHLISYLVDFMRRQTRPLPLRKYLFYLCFFPHVVAGPIVRTWQLIPQLGTVRRLPADFAFGIHFFIVGFFLKAVVANNLAEAIDPIWLLDPGSGMTAASRWIVAFLYYCQIYSDFAGYTLMALGMARLFGYRLPPNFRAPLFAGTMQDFWRRWHRTLSFWLRDYLYISLGGNRRGRFRAVINIFATMLLGGLWHGAGWNFLIWGAMHGIGLGGERVLGLHSGHTNRWARYSWWLCTQIWVTIAWVFFRSTDFNHATAFIGGMFHLNQMDSLTVDSALVLPLLIAAAAVVHQLTPFWIGRVPRRHLGLCLGFSSAILLLINVVVHSPSKVFIYFNF